ncbi:flagellar type III secretion system protein FlhB [Aestuariibius sp. 2305UL40-4]|uniref:flagellar type III secretion system protein FlhB n=1 Tax=Aestuariibius violaceus TaxID=3234132 RepID=UPI00345E58CD
MSGQDEGEKEHEPSQKKLDDARRKGEVPRSNDLITAAAYGGLLLAALAMGGGATIQLGTALAIPLDQADALPRLFFDGAGTAIAGGLIWAAFIGTAPWVLIPAICALLCVIGQRALIFAPTKLTPKLSRISPIQNAKNKFGRSGLFEFLKSFLKLVLISGVLAAVFIRYRAELLSVATLDPPLAAAFLGTMLIRFLVVVLVIAAVFGALDLLFQRAEHLRKHRMTRKELMDEFKTTEGDPAMKQKRRQKAQEIAARNIRAEVPKADVIVVNPTHFAVALGWDRNPGSAPVCLAKGVDEIALQIRQIAAEAGVPIHSDPPTARALHASVEVGDQIHPDHYRAVAAAIRFADRLSKKKLK